MERGDGVGREDGVARGVCVGLGLLEATDIGLPCACANANDGMSKTPTDRVVRNLERRIGTALQVGRITVGLSHLGRGINRVST